MCRILLTRRLTSLRDSRFRPHRASRYDAGMSKFVRSLFVASLIFLSSCAHSPFASSQTEGIPSDRFREATELLKQHVADNKIAGAVAAVSHRGKVVYHESVGVQDQQSRAPMTERSLFRIYSMTRPITSVAVMILYEEKRFDLDDPVSKFIPEFADAKVALPDGSTRPPKRAITVADLLLHTSGLSPRTAEIYRREKVRAREYTMDQFIANLMRVPLMEDPGTRFRYSEGTSVLGRLVEIWSGQPFERFLAERVFEPLEMKDTSFWAETPEQRARLTTVYTPAANGSLTPIELETIPFTQRPTLIEGAVGLISTVPDYLRFARFLLNKGELEGVRLLRAETVELMTRNGLANAVQQTRGQEMGWALGNVAVRLRANGIDPENVGEYGWDGTAGTIFWIDPHTQTAAVLMTQSSPADPDGLRSKFRAIVQRAVASP